MRHEKENVQLPNISAKAKIIQTPDEKIKRKHRKCEKFYEKFQKENEP